MHEDTFTSLSRFFNWGTGKTCGRQRTQYFRVLIKTNFSLLFHVTRSSSLREILTKANCHKRKRSNASIKKNSLPLHTFKTNTIVTYRQFEERLCQQDQVVKCSKVYPSPILSTFRHDQTPLWTATSHSNNFRVILAITEHSSRFPHTPLPLLAFPHTITATLVN